MDSSSFMVPWFNLHKSALDHLSKQNFPISHYPCSPSEITHSPIVKEGQMCKLHFKSSPLHLLPHPVVTMSHVK